MKQCSCPTADPSALSAKVSICAEAPANGADFREQNSNYHQLEKLKNEMFCLARRRKCGLNHIEEEQQRNQPFLSFPQRAGQSYPSSALFVAHVPQGTHRSSTP